MENLLPTEMTLNILSRLPVESVLQCRLVCKTWRTLLHHPYFAQMHLLRSLQLDKMGILYLNREFDSFSKHFSYGEYDENDEQSYKTFKRINHPPITMDDTLVGSCNGLVCLSVSDECYICNPMTREYINLPRYRDDTTIGEKCFVYMVRGFGCIPSTNEYKVVIICYCCDRDHDRNLDLNKPSPLVVGYVKVYTLGSGSGWRDKGTIMSSLYGKGVLANGALYWLDDKAEKIVVFDLAEEQFRLLSLPPFAVRAKDNYIQIQALGGLLCIIHRRHGKSIDIWSLKEKNSTTYDMKEQEHHSGRWTMKFSIAMEGLNGYSHVPFAFTKSGELLLWYKPPIHFVATYDHSTYCLCHYDPKTATLKKFDTDLRFVESIPHVNSFVSLKALGEEGQLEEHRYISVPKPYSVEEAES